MLIYLVEIFFDMFFSWLFVLIFFFDFKIC